MVARKRDTPSHSATDIKYLAAVSRKQPIQVILQCDEGTLNLHIPLYVKSIVFVDITCKYCQIFSLFFFLFRAFILTLLKLLSVYKRNLYRKSLLDPKIFTRIIFLFVISANQFLPKNTLIPNTNRFSWF